MQPTASQPAAMPAAALSLSEHADAAEAALQQGLVDVALAAAKAALQKQTPAAAADDAPPDAEPQQELQQQGQQLQAQARALSVLIQAEFSFRNALVDLDAGLSQAGIELSALPVGVVLLWGVVAVELQAADAARRVLGAYLSGKDFGEHATDVSRADALALSRLYAVQLLAGLCQDFDGAASWLEAGGAGLSEEQQELLLMEVDEAEELVQEEHLAAWTVQHAAEAGQPGDACSSGGGVPAGASASAPAGPSATSSVVGSCSLASTAGGAAAAFQELGLSVSGVLSSSSSLHPEGSGGSSLLQESAPGTAATAAAQDGSRQQQQHLSPEQGEAAASLPAHAAGAAAGDSAAPTASMLLAAVAAAAAGSESGYVCSAGSGDREPSSPSLAGWRVADADESSLHDQGGHEDGNPFVTLTGELDDGVDAVATAGAANGSQPGSKTGSPKRPGSLRSSNSSSSRALSRAAAVAAATAVAAAAAAAADPEIQAAPQDEQQQQQAVQQEQEQEQSPQQQPQSWAEAYQAYTSWASNKAAEVWGSSRVQGALEVLHLQDVPPWELAGGAGLAVLVSYSLYRERRNLKRAAASLASSVAQTAGMALGGLRPLNAMGAAPGTGHVAR